MRAVKPIAVILAVLLTVAGCKAWLDEHNPLYCPPGQPGCGCNGPNDPCHEPTEPCNEMLFNHCAKRGGDAGSDGDAK